MKYIKLFEDYDNRYNFGSYDNHQEISELYNSLEETRGIFTEEEINILHDICRSQTKFNDYASSGVVYFSINEMPVVIISFGDFCYGIFVEFRKDSIYYWKSAEIIDEFDNLCSSLKTLIDKYREQSLNESVTRYDFGKYTNSEEIDGIFSSFQALGAEFDDLGVFSKSDIVKIDEVFNDTSALNYQINKPKNTITFQIAQKYYLVYALGDYCFAIFEEDTSLRDSWSSCEIIDEIDVLCDVLKKFIYPLGVINERFDRYEFGVYTDSNIIDELYDEFTDKSIMFTIDEEDMIYEILNGKVELLDIDRERGYVFFDIGQNAYTVYALGDYCFVVFEDHQGTFKLCEIIDEFDNLCITLRKIISKPQVLNESVTRYDFGIIEDEESIRSFLMSIKDENLNENEINEIKSILPDGLSLNKTIYGPYTIDGMFSDINIYSLGDYCFALSIGNFSNIGYTYEKMYLIDEFENLIDTIKNNIIK